MIILNNVFMENQIFRNNEIFLLKYTLKKLFDVIYQFSLRKHSAKAVSSGFLIEFKPLHILQMRVYILYQKYNIFAC